MKLTDKHFINKNTNQIIYFISEDIGNGYYIYCESVIELLKVFHKINKIDLIYICDDKYKAIKKCKKLNREKYGHNYAVWLKGYLWG